MNLCLKHSWMHVPVQNERIRSLRFHQLETILNQIAFPGVHVQTLSRRLQLAALS